MLGSVTPILRIFDEAKARAFYVGLLGFRVDFSHRFGDGYPLYLGISQGACRIHLSEHFGDCCPGAHVRIACDDVDGLSRSLEAKGDPFVKPGVPDDTLWGTRELTLSDPFGNRLTFVQARA